VTKLGVNIDHIATIREARQTNEPDPIDASALVELAGGDGITIHLRGDRRHIKERDLHLLRQVVKTKINLEMAATEEMVQIALKERPDMATLVPERPEELTTQGGLDVVSHSLELKRVIETLRQGGIKVSIFVDPNPEQIQESHKVGADFIEINTGKYAEAKDEEEAIQEYEKIKECAQIAKRLGLRVLAGHGLTYRNVKLISDIPEIEELNIGHNIIARAALVGLERAVREMKYLME